MYEMMYTSHSNIYLHLIIIVQKNRVKFNCAKVYALKNCDFYNNTELMNEIINYP